MSDNRLSRFFLSRCILCVSTPKADLLLGPIDLHWSPGRRFHLVYNSYPTGVSAHSLRLVLNPTSSLVYFKWRKLGCLVHDVFRHDIGLCYLIAKMLLKGLTMVWVPFYLCFISTDSFSKKHAGIPYGEQCSFLLCPVYWCWTI